MRKVIGIGEIILDMIMKDGQPHSAVPGGSVFNAMVSLSRLGIPVSFIGEVGNDKVGTMILDFMQTNSMATDYINHFYAGKTPVSLAFLDETNNAEYFFYTNHTTSPLNTTFPTINPDDIVLIASYYALNPSNRERIVELLEYAKAQKAIIYYDLNFRNSHIHDAIRVRSSVIENYEFADIVRGSDEDFTNLYGNKAIDQVYKHEVEFYCKRLITTHGPGGVNILTESLRAHYDSIPIVPVCTIGAGDNFNAGFIYGLIKHNIGLSDLPSVNAVTWNNIIRCGIDFSTEVCQSFSNYISSEFATNYSMH